MRKFPYAFPWKLFWSIWEITFKLGAFEHVFLTWMSFHIWASRKYFLEGFNPIIQMASLTNSWFITCLKLGVAFAPAQPVNKAVISNSSRWMQGSFCTCNEIKESRHMFFLQLFITILRVLKELTDFLFCTYFNHLAPLFWISCFFKCSATLKWDEVWEEVYLYHLRESKLGSISCLKKRYVCLNCFSPCIPMCSVRYFFSLKNLVCLPP